MVQQLSDVKACHLLSEHDCGLKVWQNVSGLYL